MVRLSGLPALLGGPAAVPWYPLSGAEKPPPGLSRSDGPPVVVKTISRPGFSREKAGPGDSRRPVPVVGRRISIGRLEKPRWLVGCRSTSSGGGPHRTSSWRRGAVYPTTLAPDFSDGLLRRPAQISPPVRLNERYRPRIPEMGLVVTCSRVPDEFCVGISCRRLYWQRLASTRPCTAASEFGRRSAYSNGSFQSASFNAGTSSCICVSGSRV